MNLFKKICLVLVALLIVYDLILLQKKNNYKRCVSVVSAAVATGKFNKDTNIHNMCKYHLDFSWKWGASKKL
jgi:hypothetical protein